MENLSLHFNGPYSFTKRNSLFYSEHADKEGIYLWVIKDTEHNVNYIHYIGETTNFRKRHREHIIHILGLNYYIINAKQARKGIHEVIWSGMWRDKSKDAVGNTIEQFDSVADHVTNYIDCIDIYFAPTNLPSNTRKHIEGSIGWNLRNKYPELNTFYPKDNHIGTSKENLNLEVLISSDEPIAGVDSRLNI